MISKPDLSIKYFNSRLSEKIRMTGMVHIAKIYSRSVYKCPVYFQNSLWESIYHGDYKRLVYLTGKDLLID